MKKVRVIRLNKNNNIDLLATFVHELKTPVTSIKEAISLLSDLNQKTLNPKSNHILSIAHEEVNRLVKMIENFLKFASIEAGKIQLQAEPVKIKDLINQVIESQSLMIQKKKMHVKQHCLHKSVTILADRDRLFEVIANLIDNALKFTPENGTITILTTVIKSPSSIIRKNYLNPNNSYLMITVSDSGHGIPKKYLESIFKKFERIKTPSRTRGIGLGLTIAKDIIELHHGKIWATSKKGEGANFHFVLPIKTQPN